MTTTMTDELLNLTISTQAQRRDGSRVTLYRGIAMPAGVESFVIRDDRSGAEYQGTTVGSLALRIFREVFAIEVPAQIESPLPAAERSASGLARGATLTMPTIAQHRIMHLANETSYSGRIWRGGQGWQANLRMLRAMARRGWLELDHPIRPSYGTLTDAGRRALVAYEAKHGVSAGAR